MPGTGSLDGHSPSALPGQCHRGKWWHDDRGANRAPSGRPAYDRQTQELHQLLITATDLFPAATPDPANSQRGPSRIRLAHASLPGLRRAITGERPVTQDCPHPDGPQVNGLRVFFQHPRSVQTRVSQHVPDRDGVAEHRPPNPGIRPVPVVPAPGKQDCMRLSSRFHGGRRVAREDLPTRYTGNFISAEAGRTIACRFSRCCGLRANQCETAPQASCKVAP